MGSQRSTSARGAQVKSSLPTRSPSPLTEFLPWNHIPMVTLEYISSGIKILVVLQIAGEPCNPERLVGIPTGNKD